MKKRLLLLIKDKKKTNFFIYGIGQAFNLLSPLIVVPYIVLICSVEALGKTGLGFALSLFLILIVDYAFDIKGTKLIAENRENKIELQKILNTAIFTKMALFGFVFILALFLIFFIPFFSQEKTVYLLSLSIVFAQVFNPVWFLQGIEEFSLVSILNIFSKTTYVILIYTLINHKSDYVYVNFFLGSSSFVFNVIGLFFIKNKFDFDIIKPNYIEVKTILIKDFSFCISQLFLSVRQLSPLVLSGYFLGFYIAGQYKIIEQIITLFRTFIQVFLKFFYPSVCYKIIIDEKSGFGFWKRYTGLIFLFIFLSLLIIFVFSQEILSFFHLKVASDSQLNIVFKFSLIVSLLMSISLPLEQLMFITNKNRIYIKITILATIINVVLILLLIKHLYLYGIIISLIVSEIVFITMYFSNSYLPLKAKLKNEHSNI